MINLLILINIKNISLVLEKLPKHSEYGRAEFSLHKSKLKEVGTNLKTFTLTLKFCILPF